jgi:hypothetical protein
MHQKVGQVYFCIEISLSGHTLIILSSRAKNLPIQKSETWRSFFKFSHFPLDWQIMSFYVITIC